MTSWKNVLIGLAASVLFSLLYLAGMLTALEDRLYDFFLRFRISRPLIESVVFLDVDDSAIAYNGMYPWPRSIPADGLLRLKEHRARAAIFDIEYIDRGPQGVDSMYLEQGLPSDFNRSFSGINQITQDFISSVRTGRINRNDLEFYGKQLSVFINGEHEDLYTKAQGVARDNDKYLADALALYGHSWSTLNLRDRILDDQEQSARRPIAENRFSYHLVTSADAHKGCKLTTTDILPALPIFAMAAKGAGFTNVEIDNDGVRRRIFLAQNINDHWYLQLAFAPLIDYFGRPEIILEKRSLTIKQVKMPDGEIKDIVIPLDANGRMMLSWPKEDYHESFDHISFATFSNLDDIEAELEQYTRAIAASDIMFFAQFDPSLNRVPVMLGSAEELFDAARLAKNHAMENCSDESFEAFLEYRNQSHVSLGEFIALDPESKIREIVPFLVEEYGDNAELIISEAEYISTLTGYLAVNLARWKEIDAEIDRKVRDKFAILGRVDTGTTDYGANPFYGKYVNVGTHGVVLDTILKESFIYPINIWWHILFILLFVPLFFVLSAKLSPVTRAASGFAATALVVAGSILLFRYTGVFLGPLGTIFALLSAVIVREIISYAGSEKEKQFIRTAFSTYVSGDVVKEIIADPSRLQLGGTKRHMTAIFTDVKGFSTISEKLSPEDLVSLLNRYLSAMSDIVLVEKGTIDKYEGDAIIAFFGAPLDLSDHALRACVSAITMKHVEAELNKTVIEHNMSPAPLLTRIGINTGNMVAGNMGTYNKMNYTIMGNAVNLAARLEGVNKQYGTWVLASEDTVRETGDHILTRRLDRVRVVGINEPVRLYELIEIAQNASEQQIKLVEVFHEALDNFENREWKLAAKGFKEALAVRAEDPPSMKYLERCVSFNKKPPLDTWDGVYNLTEK